MTVFRNARVVDGTGAPATAADVVVEGDRIVAVTEPGEGSDGTVVDLDGLVLAPGFVDPHTHYDAQILWDPDLTPSCWHGVTTIVMGNCGFGLAPTHPRDREKLARTLENVEGMSFDALVAGIDWTFESFPEYLDALERLGPRLNVAAMIGHTPLRQYVMGDESTERTATDDEVATMRGLVGEAMDAGAIGFATSKTFAHVGAWGKPVPSRLADPSEIFEIAEALHERDAGTIAITMGEDFFVEEMAALSKRTGRPVTWTALSAGRRDPNAAEVLARTRELGGEVYPQVACRPIVAQVTLLNPYPAFARVPAFKEAYALPAERRHEVYQDPAWRARARQQIADLGPVWGNKWAKTTIQETQRHTALRDGPSMAELAAARGSDPLDVFCDLAIEDGLVTRFRVVQSNDDEDELERLLAPDSGVLLGLSDAGAHADQLCDAVFATHLLEHWVREVGALTLEEGVWRVTGHPAHVYRLHGRGRIAPGYAADLVAFDADTIGADRAERVWDFPAGTDRLVARSRGIHATWINGTLAYEDGKDLVGARTGQVIR